MLADESLSVEATIDTGSYLEHVVAVTHETHWAAAASTDAQPTWRVAPDRFQRDAALTPADIHRAHEILGWAASLRPRRTDSYRARMAACLSHERLAPE